MHAADRIRPAPSPIEVTMYELARSTLLDVDRSRAGPPDGRAAGDAVVFQRLALRAHLSIGPHAAGAVDRLVDAYRAHAVRGPVPLPGAGATELSAGPAATQEWWLDGYDRSARTDSRTRVPYGSGELEAGPTRTMSPPDPSLRPDLLLTWERLARPIVRHRVELPADLRVWRVDSASDWAELVARHPRRAVSTHGSYSLPGPHQPAAAAILAEVSGGRAARVGRVEHLVPDWSAARRDLDAVHVSWRGFVDAEGTIVDLGGAVAMLRHWPGEALFWLAPVPVRR